MDRRQFLSAAALCLSVSGCVEDGPGGATDDARPTQSETETGTPTDATTGSKTPTDATTGSKTPSGTEPVTTTSSCEWPTMCEGTRIVAVFVGTFFSGDVSFEAGCRDEEFSIQPGGSVRIDRTEDGESCPISLSVGGEQVYSKHVSSSESVTLNVTSEGEVDADVVVL